MNEEAVEYLKQIARDQRELLLHMREAVKYMKEAESEVPEKMRRFIMYFHDVHDLRDLYHQAGIEPPEHILKEIERCADRFRHLLEEYHSAGGTFEKVRREMSKKEGNRYDHSSLLSYLKEQPNEARNRTEDESA